MKYPLVREHLQVDDFVHSLHELAQDLKIERNYSACCFQMARTFKIGIIRANELVTCDELELYNVRLTESNQITALG